MNSVVSPMMIPAITDSTGNPGIPPPVTLEVVVVSKVPVVEVRETKVDTVETVTRLVDVVTVETTVDVTVVIGTAPKPPKRSIVESGLPIVVGGEPTIQPLLGEIIYTEFKDGGIVELPRPIRDGDRVT